MTTIRINHIRAANLCTRGARHWFEQKGLSWQEFLAEGLPADQVRALNDPLADRVIAAAEKDAQA